MTRTTFPDNAALLTWLVVVEMQVAEIVYSCKNLTKIITFKDKLFQWWHLGNPAVCTSLSNYVQLRADCCEFADHVQLIAMFSYAAQFHVYSIIFTLSWIISLTTKISSFAAKSTHCFLLIFSDSWAQTLVSHHFCQFIIFHIHYHPGITAMADRA